MLDNKPTKLGQLPKRLLLQQSIQLIEENERRSSKFLRYLLASKQFLTISQHKTLYTLIMKRGTLEPVAFGIAKSSNSLYVREFYLSIESAKNIIRLLKPREFDIHTSSDSKGFGEYETLINEVSCRIGFFAKGYSDLSMISNCAKNVVRLECAPENLLKSQQYSLNLEFLELIPESLYQLRQVLVKHRVKKLKTILYPSYVIVEDVGSSLSPHSDWKFESNVLEELDVRFREGPSYFLPFIYRLLYIFPSLKVLSILFYDSDIYPYDFSPTEIIGTISSLYGMFKEVNQKLVEHPNLQNFKFECIYRYHQPVENENWVNRIKNVQIFANAKHTEEEDLDGRQSNAMEVKTQNGLFKFVSKPL